MQWLEIGKKHQHVESGYKGFEFYSELTLPGSIPSLEREMERYIYKIK